ncbi:hypothetical protein EON81_04720 [bacterium]|nr:MAG: hypothetical protein EON81_04720 [bacterium]
MRRLFFAAGAAILAGCGGGSAGSSSENPSPGGGTVGQFGPIETRGQVNGTPIVRDLGAISTIALAGTLTEATYRPQGMPDNETAIVIGNVKRLDLVMETGEKITSWNPGVPANSQYFLLPKWSLDGQKLYFLTSLGIYSTTVSDPATVTPVITAANVGRYAISPDGLQIAYTRIPTGETDGEVFVRAIAGGATKRITTNGDTDIAATWVDNERVVVYNQPAANPGQGGSNIIDVSTLASAQYTPFFNGLYPVGVSTEGRYAFNNLSTNPNNSVSITDLEGPPVLSENYLPPVLSGTILSASPSPDNSRWAVGFADRIFTTEIVPKTITDIVPETPGFYYGAAWQPPLPVTKFVGASSKLGSTSAGIIATSRTGPGRKGLASFVSWDAQTRSNSNVSDDATDLGSGAKSYVIEADRLTSLKYANRPLFNTVSTVSASGTANGAIVTIDAADGTVASIVVYQETRGAKPKIRREGDRKVIEGPIQSVWNAKGENLAPQGASRVTLPATGEPQIG